MSRAKSEKSPVTAPLSRESWVVLSDVRPCTLGTSEDCTPVLRWNPVEANTVFPSRTAAESAIVACGMEGHRTVKKVEPEST